MSKGPSDRSSARGSAVDAGGSGRREVSLRWVHVAVVLGVLALNLCQQPGRLTFDTKLDLQVAPLDFLSRSLSLWNGDWAVGGLQNQASGYLFPMGPAFLLGDALGVPMWVWERLWSALVMLLAYEGARRLARAWPGIGPVGAVLAGLTYMLAPRVLTTVGGLSGETLPGSVLPWTVLPLVLYLTGRMRAVTAFVLSAATIPWMGGQNATLVVACLVLPGLLLLLAPGRPARRVVTDAGSWTLLALAASLWWLVPLFLLGGYGPPFLDFVESSRNTAGGVGWASALRGTDHWVAFFPGGGSAGWAGGYRIASSPVLMITTVLAAAAGLAGLLARPLWGRRALVVSALVGLAVLTAGSGGWAGSVFAEAWLDALDGALAPLRNVHKFDPLVRLPLSLGLGAFVTLMLPRLVRGLTARVPRVDGRLARRVALGATGLVLLATAFPAVTGDLRNDHGVEELSPSWTRAVDYLNAQPGPVRVLVLPATGSAVQTWGRTVDEPIQVLGAPPWVARSQATVAPAATIRLLDSIETHLMSGRPYDGLAETLDRLGVTHVVVRHDLDPDRTDAPPPETVDATVRRAPGLRSAARFGGEGGPRPEVEVFARNAVEPRVALADRAQERLVQGSPEVVDELVRAGLVRSGAPTLLTDGDGAGPLDVVTDSNRRVERRFGRLHEARSAVMSPTEDFRITRPAHEYTGPGIPEDLATAQYAGVVRLEASSSAGYADTVGAVRPEEHPYAAFDGSLFTSWASAPGSPPAAQWLEVGFDAARELGDVDLLFDVTAGVRVTAVELSTATGSRTVPVGRSGLVTGAQLPPGATSTLRIAVASAATASGQVRLSNVRIGGQGLARSLRVPGRVTARTSVHLQAESPRRACLPVEDGASCAGERHRLSVETPGFDRTITVAENGTWRLDGRAVAVDGPAAEELLAPVIDGRVRVEASSVFAGDPLVAGARAFDGRTSTSWYASPTDESPALVLSWGRPRRISAVRAVLDAGHPGRLPRELLVEADGSGRAPQVVATTGPDAGRMEPVRTDRLRITLPKGREIGEGEAVGVTELRIDGLEGLRHTPRPAAATGAACGFGPKVRVGGQTFETEVRGTLADVLDGSALRVLPCAGSEVRLAPGRHTVQVANSGAFALSELWLTPAAGTPAEGTGRDRFDVQVGRWSSASRSLDFSAPREAILAVPESYNPGWRATVDGEELEPTAVDGWRQGWVVPAGSGTIDLVYTPQRTFAVSTVAGLVVAGLLNVLAAVLLLGRRRSRTRTLTAPRDGRDGRAGRDGRDGASAAEAGPAPGGTRWPVAAGLALLLAAVSLPLAMGALVGAATRRASEIVVAAAAGAGLLFAAAVAVVGRGSLIAVPVLTDVVVAMVVGAIAGRVLLEGDHPRAGGPDRALPDPLGPPPSIR